MATYPSATSQYGTSTITGMFASDAKLFTVTQEFDLEALKPTAGGVIASADIINLLTLPAKTAVLAGALEVTRLATGATAQTLKLRQGTTDISATLDIGASATLGAIALGGTSGVLNATVATSAAYINVVAGAPTGTQTAAAKIKIHLVCLNLAV